MKYKIVVNSVIPPIQCESYEIGDKGVSYCFEESLDQAALIGFIPHGQFMAILPNNPPAP